MIHKNGFTILELVIVVGIMAVLFGGLTASIKKYQTKSSLSGNTETVIETLREARNLTLVSKNALAYGVHFDSDKVTLYNTAYVVGSSTNKVINLNSGVSLITNLPSGGSEILFSRLTGETSEPSTASLYLTTGPTSSTTILIYKTGTVEQFFP